MPCTVTQFQEESVSCELQPTSAPTHYNLSEPYNVPTVGSYGLRRRFFNHTGIRWHLIDSFSDYEESIATSLEAPTDLTPDGRQGNMYKGWFVAPETTSYRFHITCDDICDLYMGLNTSDPLTKTKLVYRGSHTVHRRFFH